MNRNNEMDLTAQEAEMREVLTDLRVSVHCWSEQAMSRPRAVPMAKGMARATLAWSLSALLALAAGGGSVLMHQRHVQARLEAARQAEQLRLVAAKQAQEEEELLARVDEDVARETPDAMEPLARLMAEDETR